MQLRANDCGPAALADCLRRLGSPVPYPDPASGVRLGPRGCGFGELVAEAERYGHRAVHRRVDPDSVRGLRPPAVLYLRRGHFVVYEGPGESGDFVIHDPALGRVAMGRAALARLWTGDVLVFPPDRSDPADPPALPDPPGCTGPGS
jgi:ABC-type bacteriocin/lantibiotic exporter with double-glycine peptidase domain